MSKRIIRLLICLLCFGLFFVPSLIYAESNLPPEPKLAMYPKYGATNIGEKYIYEIDALSFENNLYGVGGLELEINLSYNPSAALDKIVFPRFEGVSKQPQHGNDITIEIMAFIDNGTAFVPIKEFTFANDDGVTSMTVTREEILNVSGGVMPPALSIYFTPGDTTRYSRLESLYQTAPIVCEFTTIDNQTLYKETDTYQRYYASLHYFDDEIFTNNSYKTVSTSAFAYFNTSALTVSANKTTGLRPGDEVDLTFTLTNYSSYDNVFLYAGFQSNNITILDTLPKSEVVLPFSNWKQSNDKYYAAMYSGGAWITLKAGETVSFSQKIMIDEDFDGASIDITAFNYHNYNGQMRLGNTITLNFNGTTNSTPPTKDDTAIAFWFFCAIVAIIAFAFAVSIKRKFVIK